jgi:flagellar biosynthesis/type III secretory pathway chaperone
METDWESELAALLRELSSVQDELLGFLAEKARCLGDANLDQLGAMAPRERQLCQRLQQCHQRRGELLAQASREGLPARSLRELAAANASGTGRLGQPLKQAAARCRLLQHKSLTNWLIIQRTLLHLSQLLEIIGTGGRPSPTYEKGRALAASGALVDRAV